MPEYTTQLVNFGNIVYQNAYLHEAKAYAICTGFECVILLDGTPMLTWSPISGWRDMCG
jgi:hypothetical protein